MLHDLDADLCLFARLADALYEFLEARQIVVAAASTTMAPTPPLASLWYLLFRSSVTAPSSVVNPETMDVLCILLGKVTPRMVIGVNNRSYFIS
jgi:hypothetical protein